MCWDTPGLLRQITEVLRAVAADGRHLSTIGIDTWGVDFGLLDARGELLALPRHYRDPRNVTAMERVLQQIARERIYESTGIQFMPINSLYQLASLVDESPDVLAAAARLLFMPDLFNYWLTGEAQTDRTIASTSQVMNAATGDWDRDLLDTLAIPTAMLPPIHAPGRVVGPLAGPLAAQAGSTDVRVVLSAGHDTASAVAAVPAEGTDWAFISSGTWSLVGVEVPGPVVTPDSLAANFTNEAGVAGTVRFLKNVAGLWLLQECRRCWAEAGRVFSFDELVELAEHAAPLGTLIDPDQPRFAAPRNMPEEIAAACAEDGQPAPADEGAMVRCILESLALRYDQVLRDAARLSGRTIAIVHVVGGGSENNLLNRLTAAATQRPVAAGPVEATALGNAAVQAIAVGDLPDITVARQAVARSIEPRIFEPPTRAAEREMWNAARQRFATLTGHDPRARKS